MELDVIAEGLMFPEGPIALKDGSFLVVEIAGECLTHISPTGVLNRVAMLGGGPNGAALGPDGRVYVCNNGGMAWRWEGTSVVPEWEPSPKPHRGCIQVVDLADGSHSVLYHESATGPLHAPNDIVFDETGGFWFTDFGHDRGDHRTDSALYYARADGSSIECIYSGPFAFNGVGLSPDQKRVCVSDTFAANVLQFDLDRPGKANLPPREICKLASGQMFDSLAVGCGGEIHVGGILPGGIVTVQPDGSHSVLPIDDPYVTNICFGGDDLATAYITMSQSGRLIRVHGLGPGLELNFAR